MLLRLFCLLIGLLGTVPLIYVTKTRGQVTLSHYRYAAAGLFAAPFGFLFLLYGLILGAVIGLILFILKENALCNFIDSLLVHFKKSLPPSDTQV